LEENSPFPRGSSCGIPFRVRAWRSGSLES
jgi:hypothetical protein